MLDGTMRGDVIRFSTASSTPSRAWMPIAVEPSYRIRLGCLRIDAIYLDRLDGILHLEQAALGAEGVHATIVLASVQVHYHRTRAAGDLNRPLNVSLHFLYTGSPPITGA